MSARKFKLFTFGKKPNAHKVRGFISEGGLPWIIAADLAAPLELSERRIRQAVKEVPATHQLTLSGEDAAAFERKKNFLSKTEKRGGARRILAVSEPGLYRIIARSDAGMKHGTFAFEFVEWIAGDFLPSLRKHGAYTIDRKARAFVRQLPNWAETREAGKETRKSCADAIQAFAAYAKANGSNNSQHYFEAFTKLTYKLAIGAERPPHGRDGLGTMEFLQVQLVEANLSRLLSAEIAAKTPYKQAFANVKAMLSTMFAREARAA